MPKSNITWYKSKTKSILKDFGKQPQRVLAETINESQQTISYRLKHVYPDTLDDLIRLLDISGYEIVKKE